MSDSFLEALRKELTVDEGCKFEIYLDTKKLKTMGIGHLVTRRDAECNQPVGTKVSKERVNQLFDQDVSMTLGDSKSLFPDIETWPQEARLIVTNMIFNLGLPKFLGFRNMIKALRVGDWVQAADDGMDSKWAREDVPSRAKGLMDRLRKVKQ